MREHFCPLDVARVLVITCDNLRLLCLPFVVTVQMYTQTTLKDLIFPEYTVGITLATELFEYVYQ